MDISIHYTITYPFQLNNITIVFLLFDVSDYTKTVR